MSSTIYDTDFTKYLPTALQHDPKMTALANAAAQELLKASGLINNVLIYCRIDELPEELVDILAYDLHVDWYDFLYPLEAKRDLVKNSVRVHKKMGTKSAVETALGSLYPESEIEEWFEYDGTPGCFRVVCDVTRQRITASYHDIVRAVKLYKRLSAHMDEVIYQSHVHGIIYTHTDYVKYRTPLTGRLAAGTNPQRNTRGGQAARNFIVGTQAAGFIFTVSAAGTIPDRNIVFHNQTAQIDAETALNVFKYTNTPAGQRNAGESPQRSQRGGQTAAVLVLEDNAEAFKYETPLAGTTPDRSTVQQTNSRTVENTVQATGFSYTVKMCGSTRKL